MFARPPSAALTVRPATPLGEVWARVAAHPLRLVAAGGAALVAAAATLVLATGDPHAGAPAVRVRLSEPARLTDASAHGARVASDAGAVAPPDPAAGQAVITLPQGGRMLGTPDAAPPPSGTAPPLARAPGPPLAPAPIAGLGAPGPGGLLPVIARDGRTPFSAYARLFTPTGKPRIAVIVGGLGLNAAATRAAIERLPPEVTLSFVPYADGLQRWIDEARAAGHETVLEIPMEPRDYPNNDPGPYGLMVGASPLETVKRLEWLLSRASGYFAVTNYLGSRFLANEPAMATFGGALRARGVGFIDDGSTPRRSGAPGFARGSADSVIDQDLSGEAIERALAGLEAGALAHGQALGAGFAYPITVEAVSRWAAGLAARGYQLAPVSSIMKR